MGRTRSGFMNKPIEKELEMRPLFTVCAVAAALSLAGAAHERVDEDAVVALERGGLDRSAALRIFDCDVHPIPGRASEPRSLVSTTATRERGSFGRRTRDLAQKG